MRVIGRKTWSWCYASSLALTVQQRNVIGCVWEQRDLRGKNMCFRPCKCEDSGGSAVGYSLERCKMRKFGEKRDGME